MLQNTMRDIERKNPSSDSRIAGSGDSTLRGSSSRLMSFWRRCRDACARSCGSPWGTGIALAPLLILIVLATGFGVWGRDFPRVDGSRWQAVFLTNGQAYFGHLDHYNRGYVLLKDVYYLQVPQSLQSQTPGAQPQLNLVKLGGELHGPEDRMFIPKGQILFWEDMKSGSQVMRAIESTRQ